MAKGKDVTAKIGSWAFIIGVIIAIILGIWAGYTNVPMNATLIIILVILGLIVGFLNVTGKETTAFLLAALSLVLVTYFSKDVYKAVSYLPQVLDAIMIFVVPATIIVALKAIWALASDQ